jgi:hypothetical protein
MEFGEAPNTDGCRSNILQAQEIFVRPVTINSGPTENFHCFGATPTCSCRVVQYGVPGNTVLGVVVLSEVQ